MDDTDKKLMILRALAERKEPSTAREVNAWLGVPGVSLNDVARLLQHLKHNSYATESRAVPGRYAVTPSGMKWLQQNMRQK